MASVKFTTGNISSLPQELSNGTIYFAITDENNKKGKIIFDKDNDRYDMSGEIGINQIGFAKCETPGITPTKEILVQNDWALKTGSVLYILFSKTNIRSNPSFSIFSLDKSICYAENVKIWYNTGQVLTSDLAKAGMEDTVICYIYNGEDFVFTGWTKENAGSGLKSFVEHSVAAIGPEYTTDSKQITVNDISSVEGRYYAIESDVNGKAFVNVPWVSSENIEAIKNPYALHFGPYSYDGSEEVTVEVYQGETN